MTKLFLTIFSSILLSAKQPAQQHPPQIIEDYTHMFNLMTPFERLTLIMQYAHIINFAEHSVYKSRADFVQSMIEAQQDLIDAENEMRDAYQTIIMLSRQYPNCPKAAEKGKVMLSIIVDSSEKIRLISEYLRFTKWDLFMRAKTLSRTTLPTLIPKTR